MDLESTDITSDIVVVGSGIAGLYFSLKVAPVAKVIILTKRQVDDCATIYAQAGIAAAVSSDDSIEQHIEDTISVGNGLCHPKVVRSIIEKGPELIQDLSHIGVEFSKVSSGEYDLGLEAGHSNRRIIHAKDMTGKELHRALQNAVLSHPNIVVLENHIAINLKIRAGRCLGVYALNKGTGVVHNFSARITIIASGGMGKAFLYTSNPDTASGDGIAMAYRAGATIMNMEFIQFHPTILYHPYAKSFLVSEALRGEGAVLINQDGNRFMDKYSSAMELAPRDIVARAIDSELKRTGNDHLFLDISFKKAEFITSRFPGIYEKCFSYGIDITKEPIPVVPGAHYSIGGIRASLSGTTDIKGLLALGEAACTGFHGANRLASNSLLEAAAMGFFAAKKCLNDLQKESLKTKSFSLWHSGDAVDSDESVVVSQNWAEIRLLMSNYVGIVRSDKRLRRAIRRIRLLQDEINQYYWDFKITSDLIELRNIADVAQMVIESAYHRKESRGVHYTVNYPQNRTTAKDTLLRKSVMSDVVSPQFKE